MDFSNGKSGEGIFEAILDVVRSIPCGHVATYGQIAEKVGTPNARLVGYALSEKSAVDPAMACTCKKNC